MTTIWAPVSALTLSDTISQLQFGPDDLLAATSWDGSVHLASARGEWSAQWQTSRPQFGITWSLRDTTAYFGGAERRVSAVDCASQQQLDLVDVGCVVTSVASALGALAIGTERGVQLADLRVGHTAVGATVRTSAGTGGAIASDSVVDVDIERGGGRFVAAGDDGRCKLWDTRSLRAPLASYQPFGNAARLLRVRLDADGGAYAVASDESHVAIEYITAPSRSLVFRTNHVVREHNTLQRFPVYDLAFQGKDLATAGGDKCVYVWDYERQRLRRQVSFAMPCMCVAYSRSGRHCAVGLSSDEWRRTRAKFSERSHSKVMLGELAPP